jgi:hypothetical protein
MICSARTECCFKMLRSHESTIIIQSEIQSDLHCDDYYHCTHKVYVFFFHTSRLNYPRDDSFDETNITGLAKWPQNYIKEV